MFIVCHLLFLYFVMFVPSLAFVKSKVYTTHIDYVDGVNTEESDIKGVRSKIHCAATCEQNQHCLTFSYEASTRLCYMSSKVDTVAPSKVYGPNKRCPPHLGYKLYKKREVEICMKRVETQVLQAEAKASCADSDAHLLLMESKNMSDFIRSFLTSKSSSSVWLDGEDINGDDQMISWKGLPVPYIEWYLTGEPDGGDDNCLLAASPCPDGYVRAEHNEKCWYFSKEVPLNWTSALSKCREDDAELGRLDSQEDHDFVSSRWGRTGAWLGVNDREEKYHYVDSLGNRLSWTNWLNGPQGFSNSGLHCAVMSKHKMRDGKWEGKYCWTLKNILCMTEQKKQYIYRMTDDPLLYKEDLMRIDDVIGPVCALQCESTFDCLGFATRDNECRLLRSSNAENDFTGWRVFI